MNLSQIESTLPSKQYCLLNATYMQTLPAGHELAGVASSLLASYLDSNFKETGTTEFAGIENCAENCVLVAIRDDFPGRADRKIGRIVDLAGLYFAEVKPHVPMATSNLNHRLEFARRTGFLIMAPDEAFAVCLEREENPDNFIVAAFMTDQLGNPRPVDGISDWNLSYYASQRTIASLNQEQVKTAMLDTEMALLTERARDGKCEQRIERLKESVQLLIAQAAVAEPARTGTGAIVRRWFIEGGSAHSISKLTPEDKGWINYPTSQDAWYFGVRINPKTRETMTYAEQDVSHVICEDQRQFMAELKAMAQFYGPTRSSCARAYGHDGSVTHMYDNYFQLAGRLGVFAFANDEIVKAGETKAPLFGALYLDHPIFESMSGYPEVEFHVPADAFELDLLSPLAFEQYQCKALIHADGIDVEVVFADGKKVVGMYEAKKLEPA